jgi:hypothetical protein
MLHLMSQCCQQGHHRRALAVGMGVSASLVLSAARSAGLLIGRQISPLGHALGEMVRTISV